MNKFLLSSMFSIQLNHNPNLKKSIQQLCCGSISDLNVKYLEIIYRLFLESCKNNSEKIYYFINAMHQTILNKEKGTNVKIKVLCDCERFCRGNGTLLTMKVYRRHINLLNDNNNNNNNNNNNHNNNQCQ